MCSKLLLNNIQCYGASTFIHAFISVFFFFRASFCLHKFAKKKNACFISSYFPPRNRFLVLVIIFVSLSPSFNVVSKIEVTDASNTLRLILRTGPLDHSSARNQYPIHDMFLFLVFYFARNRETNKINSNNNRSVNMCLVCGVWSAESGVVMSSQKALKFIIPYWETS